MRIFDCRLYVSYKLREIKAVDFFVFATSRADINKGNVDIFDLLNVISKAEQHLGFAVLCCLQLNEDIAFLTLVDVNGSLANQRIKNVVVFRRFVVDIESDVKVDNKVFTLADVGGTFNLLPHRSHHFFRFLGSGFWHGRFDVGFGCFFVAGNHKHSAS